jgi:replicative DNA helicase
MTHNDESHETETVTLADLEAERSLLGAVLADNGLMERLDIRPPDFYDQAHRGLWESARSIIHRGDGLSVAVLAAAHPKMQRYVAQLGTSKQSGSPTDWARTVRDFAARRRLVEFAETLHERAGDTSIPAEEIIADATGKLASVPIGAEPVDKRRVAESVLEDLTRPVEIFPTGLAPLDEIMGGGLIAGKLYGLAARKKAGKTNLLGTISHNLNHAKVRHLFVAMEMGAKQIEQRNIARQMGFNAIKFLTRDMHDLERRVADYVATVPSFTLYEHRPGANFNTLRGLIGRARLKGIKGVILDYLQLVAGKKANETEEYHHRAVAQWLANIATETGLWVLIAAQLNQEGNTRGGEGLRLACDQYLVLHRQEDQPEAWIEMQESRYTLYANAGSEAAPAIWLRSPGPHFSTEPPPFRQGTAA